MKTYLIISFLCLPFCAEAQFIVGSQGMTIKSYATVSIDSLILSPGSDLTITNNQLTRSSVNLPVNSGNTIDRVYMFASPVTYTGSIGFKYSDTELAGNTEETLELITSDNNSGSVWITASGSTVNTTDNIIFTGVVNTSIARITAISGQALPLTIVAFNAKKDATKTMSLLSWEVANESDLKEYQIERSPDAKNFISLGTVVANGKSNYIFTDRQPLKGNNFYRLKTVSMNGGSQCSNTKLLIFDNAGAALSVYPNPVKNEYITIHSSDESLTGMKGEVVDIAGRTIGTFILKGMETQIITSSWVSGLYSIHLDNGMTFKVVKQ